MAPLPSACTIAGSDSGGGAGVQADLKTFTALGIWGTTVITAITAQNPKGVLGVSMVPEETVILQLEAVLDDFDILCLQDRDARDCRDDPDRGTIAPARHPPRARPGDDRNERSPPSR